MFDIYQFTSSALYSYSKNKRKQKQNKQKTPFLILSIC